jgi:ribonuclease P protein component
MLPKSRKLNLKLLNNKEIFTSGYYWSGKTISINFDFKKGKNKISTVVPKKVVPLAVNRNSWKRLIYQNIDEDILNLKSLRLVIKLKTRKKMNSELKDKLILDMSNMTNFILKENKND